MSDDELRKLLADYREGKLSYNDLKIIVCCGKLKEFAKMILEAINDRD